MIEEAILLATKAAAMSLTSPTEVILTFSTLVGLAEDTADVGLVESALDLVVDDMVSWKLSSVIATVQKVEAQVERRSGLDCADCRDQYVYKAWTGEMKAGEALVMKAAHHDMLTLCAATITQR